MPRRVSGRPGPLKIKATQMSCYVQHFAHKVQTAESAGTPSFSKIFRWCPHRPPNGGDWFIRILPLLRVPLPDTTSVVDGVEYTRVGLRRCDSSDLAKLKEPGAQPDRVNVIDLPGQDWRIYQVMTENQKQLLCSIGLQVNDPVAGLQSLVANDDTDRILYDNSSGSQILKYSKSLGTYFNPKHPSELAIGTYLAILRGNQNGSYLEGYNLQDGLIVLGRFQALQFQQAVSPQDFIYIPTAVKDPNRIFFVQTVIDNSTHPAWRVILPVAFSADDIPLTSLYDALVNNTSPSMWQSFSGVKVNPYYSDDVNRQTAWYDPNETPTEKSLMAQLVQKFGVDPDGAEIDPVLLQPHFTVAFTPSLNAGRLNHAAFRHGNVGSEIVLPTITQGWRIHADKVHELTHALQTPCEMPCSEDRLFNMEMEAHTNERTHIAEMIGLNPPVEYARTAFNYLVAAGLPSVEWSDNVIPPLQRSLCDDVMLGYGFNPANISSASMRQWNCPVGPLRDR